MILDLVVAASTAAQSPPAAVPPPVSPTALKDASRAIEGGRYEEAKLIIGRAIASGVQGPAVDRATADLAFATGDYARSLAGYERLVGSPAKAPGDCEKGAISALQIGRITEARPLVDCAVSSKKPSWRAWNARGVLADFENDWAIADKSYARAHELAPNEARIINNQGWSKLLRGEWAAAMPFLEEAASLDGKSPRITNNLELAKAALSADLPRRRVGEPDRDWAARLNDAGVAAEFLGDTKRAIAAFTQALEASPVWYDRASNNLKALSQN